MKCVDCGSEIDDDDDEGHTVCLPCAGYRVHLYPELVAMLKKFMGQLNQMAWPSELELEEAECLLAKAKRATAETAASAPR